LKRGTAASQKTQVMPGTSPDKLGLICVELKTVKKIKGLDIMYCHLQGNPGQQQFTVIRSGLLTGNDTRWRSASRRR